MFREDGIDFEEKKFLCVRADKNSIYAKDERRGLVLGKSRRGLVSGKSRLRQAGSAES